MGRIGHGLDVISGNVDALVLAHQGGWDETLMVLVPVALIVILLAVAKRRAERAAEAAEPPERD